MNKKAWAMIILLPIIFFMLGFSASYFFVNDNQTNNNLEQKEESKPNEDKKQDYSFQEIYPNENLEEILKNTGYEFKELTLVKEFANGLDNIGKSFIYNDQEIFINCNGKLTKNNPSSCDNEITNKITVYYYNGFYIEIIHYPLDEGKLIIYDGNIASLKEGNYHKDLYILNNDIFYGVNNCSGNRTDGKKGEVVEVHKFNTDSKEDIKVFNMDHNAGWSC